MEGAQSVAPPQDSRLARWTIVASILGSSMAFIDGSVVNVALPAIQHDLGGGLAAQQWVVDAYLLTLGSLILVGGSLGDIFGEFQYKLHSGDIHIPRIDLSEPLRNECAHFVECVEKGTKPQTDGQNGLRVIKVLEAAQRSLGKRGAPVEVT